jgi:hypothetical protein
MPALSFIATKPAGGAALDQVFIATALAGVAATILLVLVFGHRSGRIPVFARLGAVAERVSGMRDWAALPGTVLIVSLTIAVFGMYWDVGTHLDNGRDPGPLANPAHYFILAGLFGVLFAGVVAMAMPLHDGGRAEVKLPNGWRTPVGALLIAVCGAFSLIAFPLDDVWHRLFGQDVTLWGPTHLMLISGAALSIIGAWLLQVEGLGGRLTRDVPGLPTWARVREAILAGSFLIGMSTYQDEFDMGVPQFRLVFHPVLLMLAAGIVLVAARTRIGRGGALGAVAVFLSIRFALSVIVGPILDHTQPHVPTYIVGALVVEAIGFWFAVEKRPVKFGALCGLGIGTVGLAAEWGWSHIWAVIAWPSNLFPDGAVLGFVTAVAAGVLGGYLGQALTPAVRRGPSPKWPAPVAGLTIAAVIAIGLQMPVPKHPPSATVATHQVPGGPGQRNIDATVRLNPPDAADHALWLNMTSWQGGGSVIDPLERVGEGVYRTTKPIPVSGEWKTTLRLQRGAEVLSVPVFLPKDPAIPVKEIPASQHFTRPFVNDKQNLQREQKKNVPAILTTLGYLAVMALALGLLGLIVWGLMRVDRSYRDPASGPPAERARRPATTTTGRVAPAR